MAESPYLAERRFPKTDELAGLYETASLQDFAAAVRVTARIADAVSAAGGRPRYVGGIVRDVLLGKISKDIDLETAGLSPQVFEDIVRGLLPEFDGTIIEAGKNFAVLKLALPSGIVIDLSLARRESKVAEGHRGFTVDTDANLSDEEAFRRRDFTINALGAVPQSGELIDLHGGLDDLEHGILRIVDRKTFSEDSLRVLRGLQFFARFELTLDPASKEIMRELAPKVTEQPSSRVGEEWLKLLMKAKNPSRGMQLGMELGVYNALHPELESLPATPLDPKAHPEGDAWAHTCLAVDAAAALARERSLPDEDAKLLLLATLCHVFGAPRTHVASRDDVAAHASAAIEPTRSFLRRLDIAMTDIAAVEHLVVEHHAPAMLRSLASGGSSVRQALRRSLERLAPARSDVLAALTVACALGRAPAGIDAADAAELEQWYLGQSLLFPIGHAGKPRPILTGEDVLALLRSTRGGPEIGRLIALANDVADTRALPKNEIEGIIRESRDAADAMQKLQNELEKAA